ncbi:ferritin [Sporosarcina limicola]|uniref:Ferritin n=1 Tax=Sporosarcina limicola TaxID=34101 RepID=A0A927MIY6_9BACL|nr:ferritin [Sporosarcina limicola]MBE1555530.1 ferritin [Sporosarcina limicola]
MLSSKIADALNRQMNNEFDAAQAYLAMGAYCEHNNYGGFANFYLQQAEEERFHGMKIYQYLNNRGVHAKFSSITEPKTDFKSVLDTFESALQQEKSVTKNFYLLTDLAWEEKEHATISFLKWFLDEQVEEEASIDTHIEYLKRIGEDKNALFLYEKELGQRVFTPDNA